jgi:hypothetical protein
MGFHTPLPALPEFMDQPWEQFALYYRDLIESPLEEDNLYSWLEDWSELRKLVDERYARLQLANNQDTGDEAAEKHFPGCLLPPLPGC